MSKKQGILMVFEIVTTRLTSQASIFHLVQQFLSDYKGHDLQGLHPHQQE